MLLLPECAGRISDLFLLPVWLDQDFEVDFDEGLDDVHEGYVNHAVRSDNILLIGKNEKEVSMMVGEESEQFDEVLCPQWRMAALR